MEIEDRFGITIPDADAQKLLTVGSIYNYLTRRLSSLRSERCITQATFYRLRHAMTTTLGLSRNSIGPHTTLEHLLSVTQWRRRRRDFGKAASLELPMLVRPAEPRVTNWSALVFIVAAAIVPLLGLKSFTASLAAVLAAAITVSLLARSLPRSRILSSASMRDLVQSVVVLNKLPSTSAEWTEERVWLNLKQIIVDQLGVKPDEVTPEARIVEDFGAD